MKNKIIITLLVLSIFFFYLFINPNSYKSKKFGANYNDYRIENNIPTLSDDWLLRNDKALLEYYNKDSITLGHIKKYINLSKSATGSERDVFKLNNVIIISLFERNDKNKVLYKIENPSNGSINIFQSEKEVIDNNEANELLESASVDFQFDKSWNVNIR